MRIDVGFIPSCSEYTIYINKTARFKEVEEDLRSLLNILIDSCDGIENEYYESLIKKYKLDQIKLRDYDLKGEKVVTKLVKIKKEYLDNIKKYGYGELSVRDVKIFGKKIMEVKGYTGDHGEIMFMWLQKLGLDVNSGDEEWNIGK